MSANYSWVISKLECYPLHEKRENVVFNIYWRRQLVENKYLVDICGSTPIDINVSTAFTPYNSLTSEQVKDWLENSLGQEKIAEIDASLANDLTALHNPRIVAPSLPWDSVDVSVG